MKMKKMMFLMLTLMVLGAASMNAQVTIGSDEEPHAGAVLDLQSTDKGLLLPQVPISGGYNFDLPGDAKKAEGMMIYNTGNLPGLYVWNGNRWNSLQVCTLPLAPTAITYNLDITQPVATNALLKISSDIVVGATAYSWTLPNNLEEQGIASARTITVRVKGEGAIDLSKLSVRAVNACGKGPAVSGSGTLTAELKVPAKPTFTIPRTTVDPNSSITLTCGDVGADSYTWTFPEGFVGTSPTTTNTIQLRAPAVVSGIVEYPANLFSVVATNEIGSSMLTTATGDGISVGHCESAAIIDTIEYNAATSYSIRSAGFQITLTATVRTTGSTQYEWSIPQGVTIISNSTNANSISVLFDKPGRYGKGSFKCTATNSCGSGENSLLAEFVIIDSNELGSLGEDLIGDNTYRVWIAPERTGLGTWMVEFSSEGNPDFRGVPGHEDTHPWGYYTSVTAPDACPGDWHVPTTNQLRLLAALTNGDPTKYLYKLLWSSAYGWRVTASGVVNYGTGYVGGDDSEDTISTDTDKTAVTVLATQVSIAKRANYQLLKCVKN